MRHVCIKCGLSSSDGNLWCQRRDCSAQYLNRLFRPGDRLGEMEIKTCLRVMRTAAIYRATRAGRDVLIKIAHTGDGYVDDIKREAEILHTLWTEFPAKEYPPFLPRLASPYSSTDLANPRAPRYGRLALQDELRYFIVFEDMQGFFLRDLLDDTPQPQYNYAGWLALGLVEALRFFKARLKLHHGALYPEIIYVRIDRAGVYFPVLFDLGLGQKVGERISAKLSPGQTYEDWITNHLPGAYTAPEVYSGVGGEGADIYGVGLIFYEMLAGHPAFEHHSTNHEAVQEAVNTRRWKALPHKEEDLRKITERSLRTMSTTHPTGTRAQGAYNSLDDIGKALIKSFGEVPAETRREGFFNARNQTRLMWAALIFLVTLVLISLPTAITSLAVTALATPLPTP